MGVLPPEPEPVKAPPVRVSPEAAGAALDEAEQAELAQALAELNAQAPMRAKQ
jgi:hypothetical protein